MSNEKEKDTWEIVAWVNRTNNPLVYKVTYQKKTIGFFDKKLLEKFLNGTINGVPIKQPPVQPTK